MTTTSAPSTARPGLSDEDARRLRADFPLLQQDVAGEPLAYLDSGATAQRPSAVLDAERRFLETVNSAVHRGAHTLAALATEAFGLGLVDEVQVIVVPVVVGGGAPLYPQGTRLDLRLVDQRTFGNGMVQLRYDVRR